MVILIWFVHILSYRTALKASLTASGGGIIQLSIERLLGCMVVVVIKAHNSTREVIS